ncbi:hypothetical protein [Kribbella sp. CA-293567]|uniref:hypothetical protein n=1 Tax=Kribbella sp. CA-293567 TaxID=3002436 RepID=UPI0022DE2C74|nr:hypothetical protein [Kribbella sp. CA-293567]WBQ02255.1 hypothetical protein OX958_19930 [Kribbella sp. CA-293567]
MSQTGWIVVAVLMGAVVIGAALILRRDRYIKSLRDRGWTFEGSPGFDAVARLANPPFGLGFRRDPDDQITGVTSSYRPFQVIEYGAENWKGWVGMVTLSRRLPELWIMDGNTRPRYGVEAARVPSPAQLGEGWQIGALDPEYAGEVLSPQVCAQLVAMAGTHSGLNLGIDGDQLVVLDPPRKDPERLAAWIEQLAAVAAAIDATPLDRWVQLERPSQLSFYHHPDWHWIGEDDSLLQTTPATRSGHDHTTSEVIRGRDGDGPPFVAFTHEWKTTRTESYTDSEGRSQTRTVTDSHSEHLLGFQLPVTMPPLKVGRRGIGRGITFESGAFNSQFAVRAEDTKYAYDVIHPRQMEYLMADPPAPFEIAGGWAWFETTEHSQDSISHSSRFLRGFLARVPRFVWRNLGLPDSPYPPLDQPAQH